MSLLKFFLLLFCGTTVYGQGFEHIRTLGQKSEIQKGNGISVADYDNNGSLDVYIVAAEAYDPLDRSTWNRLLKNVNGSFVDATEQSGLLHFQYNQNKPAEMGIKMGASWGDFNNDGYPDLFLTNYGLDQLWENNGDGTFTDITENAGVAGCECYSSSSVWWDYNVDGKLDLYVSDWNQPNRLFRNDGEGRFSDVSTESNLAVGLQTWTALPIDVNYDTYPDLYLMNDFADNDLFVNQKDGTFLEATKEYRLNDIGHGMGVDVCDLFGDGDFDIYLTNIWQEHPNPFFVNKGIGFRNEWLHRGFKDAGWGWGVRFLDMDHDTDEDMYLVNQQHFLANGPDYNRLFVASDNKFEESASKYGVNNENDGRGLVVFDYNNDGDLDMAFTNWGHSPVLYSNTIEKKGNWIKVDLEGTKSNRNAFGAVLKIKTGEKLQHRLNHGANFLGQDIKPLHFGLGNSGSIDELVIFWPSGLIEKVYGIGANQSVKFVEGQQQEVIGETYGSMKKPVVATIDNESQVFTWKAYPNPFSDHVKIQFSGVLQGEVGVEIVGVSGVVYFSRKYKMQGAPLEIIVPEVKTLTKGIYFVRINNGGQEVSRKIIKN
ncbi:MAG: FG-GAP-like repeat-containing protein [Cyclobacteriaceae bacterium]